VLRHFGPTKSEEDGQIQVDLGGRAFRIAPAFIEELQAQAENPVKGLRAALLVMHAPSDAVVDIGEAQDLFKRPDILRVSSAWTMRTICSRARPMRSMRLT
jgi:putative redox protein